MPSDSEQVTPSPKYFNGSFLDQSSTLICFVLPPASPILIKMYPEFPYYYFLCIFNIYYDSFQPHWAACLTWAVYFLRYQLLILLVFSLQSYINFVLPFNFPYKLHFSAQFFRLWGMLTIKLSHFITKLLYEMIITKFIFPQNVRALLPYILNNIW